MKERENIAVLGPAGTFCDQALAQYRAKTGCKDQALYCASIEGVFHAVAEGCQRAVVPIENTLDGYVQVSLDGLLETKARITGELYVPVQFALVGNVDSAKDIRRLYVQFKAKGQCQKAIESLGDVQLMITESNMESYQRAEEGREGEAAIIPQHMYEASRCRFKQPNVTDAQSNDTRFFVLEAQPGALQAGTAQKRKMALYVLDAADKPGTLFEILRQFAIHQINLAALMSRPTKKGMGTYNFYLEVSVDKAQLPVLQTTIRALKRDFTLKVLGEYAAL